MPWKHEYPDDKTYLLFELIIQLKKIINLISKYFTLV